MKLILDRVTKQFKNKIAVDRISLEMEPGIYGLLGPNGAGKTTLMRMMAGILPPDSGTVSLDGLWAEREEYRARLGYLPQDFGYYPGFTVWDFLLYLSALKGISRERAKVKIQELLELTGLKELEKRRIKTLSGGMKQRLGIAQALLNDPELLILDEPTSGLDPKERVRFRNMISELKQNRIILLSTHIVSDVEYIADTIAVMQKGRILHKGSLQEILPAAEGKIWECCTDHEEAKRLCQTYTVIHLREQGNQVFLRLAGEKKPMEKARPLSPSLEDLYLYYFGEQEEQR